MLEMKRRILRKLVILLKLSLKRVGNDLSRNLLKGIGVIFLGRE